jgi:hypothetical protein
VQRVKGIEPSLRCRRPAVRTTSRMFGAGRSIIGSIAPAIPVTITEAEQTAQQLRSTAAHLGTVDLGTN